MTELTQQLSYQANTLHMENCSLQQLAAQVSGPFYCYSQAAIITNIQQCKNAFSDPRFTIHYAMKANSNLSILRLIAEQGLAVDIVSIGEMQRALAAGFNAQQVVFSGVGKTTDEMQQAINLNVGQFNVESVEELSQLIAISSQLGKSVTAMIRVNPEVSIDTHQHITTGARGNKFGVSLNDVLSMLQLAQHSAVNIVGLAMHIGSQIQQTAPYLAAIDKLLELITALQSQGFNLTQLDLGGGFGISYGQLQSLSFEQFSLAITDRLQHWQGKLSIEPGRSIVADTGLLVSPITNIKKTEARDFVIVEAAMNDLMRPALYQARHPLIPVTQMFGEHAEFDVVGPICESTDTFEKNALLPAQLQAGDLLCFLYSGAYSAVMSNSYNSRSIISEILINGASATCIRQAISTQDLMQYELKTSSIKFV